MEPHNSTEQDFRDKLNAREIMPSDKAWDRLDAMLTVAEEKKSKRGYGWLYIAAAILGFLLIGTVFFSKTEEVIDKSRDEVVFGNPIEPSQPSDELVPTATEEQAVATNENPQIIQINKNNHPSKPNQSTKNQSSINQRESINPVEALAANPDQQTIASAPITLPKAETHSARVDELLAAAQSANPKTSVKVNAKNLLSEVDRDVNETFREKMLRRANEVAGAVANRNNE